MKITSKEPDWELYDEFLSNEVRYNALKKFNPDHASELLEQNKKDSQRRYRQLVRFSKSDFSDEI